VRFEDADDSVSLLKVRRGSAHFVCAAKQPERALSNLRLAGQLLNSPDQADQLAYAFTPIEELSAIARSLGCTITLRPADERQAVLATIEPETFGRLASQLLLEGDTTITGRVERVGGATEMRCALRVAFQHRLLYCRVVGEDAVRKLGQSLYEDVAVSGTARWIRNSWRIVAFTVRDVAPQPKPGSLAEAFGAIREAGGKGWGRYRDPRKHLQEVSGD